MKERGALFGRLARSALDDAAAARSDRGFTVFAEDGRSLARLRCNTSMRLMTFFGEGTVGAARDGTAACFSRSIDTSVVRYRSSSKAGSKSAVFVAVLRAKDIEGLPVDGCNLRGPDDEVGFQGRPASFARVCMLIPAQHQGEA